MPITRPKEQVHRDNARWQELLKQHTDIQRLWKRAPAFPEQSRPWFGDWAHGVDGFGTTSSTSSTSSSSTTQPPPTSSTSTSSTSTSTSSTTTCSPCDVSTWSLTAADIANDSCSSCGGFNGTFNLDSVAAGTGETCRWESSEFGTSCNGGTGLFWRLVYSGNILQLFAMDDGFVGEVTVAEYKTTDPDCTEQTVDFDSANSQCTNWPATLTVTPT